MQLCRNQRQAALFLAAFCLLPGPSLQAALRASLEGFWSTDTLTPVQRLPGYSQGRYFSDAEARQFVHNMEHARRVEVQNLADFGARLTIRADRALTSLIYEPENGKLPTFVEPYQRLLSATKARLKSSSGYWDLTERERCLAETLVPMRPREANGFLQIIETDDAVMILSEMIHDVRTIYLDARPHLPATAPQLLGDSLGHWEGDTLVVDTVNFKPSVSRMVSPALHVVERFHRSAPDTITYQARAEDPGVFTQPWALEYDFHAVSGPALEYACHEGNRDVPDLIRAADRTPSGWVRRISVSVGYRILPPSLRSYGPRFAVGALVVLLTLATVFAAFLVRLMLRRRRWPA